MMMLVFIAQMLGGLVDPIALAGYAAAGYFIRQRGAAIIVGMGWRVGLGIAVASLVGEHQVRNPLPWHPLVPAVAGAALATFIFHLLGERFRQKRLDRESEELKRLVREDRQKIKRATEALAREDLAGKR